MSITIVIDNIDRTQDIPFATDPDGNTSFLTITETVPGTATADLRVYDPTATIDIPRLAPIRIYDNTNEKYIFTGYVQRRSYEIVANYRFIRLSCVDLNAILDTTLVGTPNGSYWTESGTGYVPADPDAYVQGGSDAENVQRLFTKYWHYILEIDTTTYVTATNPSITADAPLTFERRTLREALNEIADLAGPYTRYWIDADAKLHWTNVPLEGSPVSGTVETPVLKPGSLPLLFPQTNPSVGNWSPGNPDYAVPIALGDVSTSAVSYANGAWFTSSPQQDICLAYASDPNGPWTTVIPSGAGGQLFVRNVVYADGYWVASGATSYPSATSVPLVLYAPTPSGPWDAQTFGGATGYSTAVAYGDGTFAVTKSTTGGTYQIAYTDAANLGGTWSIVTSPVENPQYLAAANGYWVIVGTTSTFLGTAAALAYATALNGTWTVLTDYPLAFDGSTPNYAYSVTYLNGYWFVGDQFGVIYSTSPIGPWVRADTPTGAMFRLAYSHGYWLAVGSGQVIWTDDPTGAWYLSAIGSTDVQSLIAANDAGTFYIPSTTGAGFITTVTDAPTFKRPAGIDGFEIVGTLAGMVDPEWAAYGNGYWATMSYTGVTNGISLAYATDPNGPWTITAYTNVGSYTNIFFQFANGYFIRSSRLTTATPWSSLYWATTPVGPWSSVVIDATGATTLRGIEYANGTWLLITSTTTYYTATSLSGPWTSQTLPTTFSPVNVAYGGGQWRIIGNETSGPSGAWSLSSTSPTGPWSTVVVDFGAQISGSKLQTLCVAYGMYAGQPIWVLGLSAGCIAYAYSPSGPWFYATGGFTTTTQTLALAYNNGYWVGGNSSGEIRYTTNPTGTWTLATTVSVSWRSVGCNGTHWVIVGTNGTIRVASAAGAPTTWSAPSTPNFFTSIINTVAYASPYWVAASSTGLIRTATDPTTTWSAVTSSGFSTSSITAVAYGGGTWVAVGAAGKVTQTTNPTGTWAAATSPGFSPSTVNSVTYTSPYWVAVGSTGEIRYTTTPGGTWSGATAPGFGTENITKVIAGNGMWVATSINASPSNHLRYTTNPTGTWTGSSTLPDQPQILSAIQTIYAESSWLMLVSGGAVSNAQFQTDIYLLKQNIGSGSWLPVRHWSYDQPGWFNEPTSRVRPLLYANGYVAIAGFKITLRSYVGSTAFWYASDVDGPWRSAYPTYVIPGDGGVGPGSVATDGTRWLLFNGSGAGTSWTTIWAGYQNEPAQPVVQSPGITGWTDVTDTALIANPNWTRTMVYGNGLWVMGLSSVTFPATYPIIVWTKDPTGSWQSLDASFFPNFVPLNSAYGNGYWVLAGVTIGTGGSPNTGTIIYTNNPSAGWAAVPSANIPVAMSPGQSWALGLTFGDGVFAVSVLPDTLIYAADPSSLWRVATFPGFGPPVRGANSVVYGDGWWGLFASDGDGTTQVFWAPAITGPWTLDESTPSDAYVGGGVGGQSIAYGDGYWVITYQNIATSAHYLRYKTNGAPSASWVTVPLPSSAWGQAVYQNGYWLIADSDGGVFWATEPAGPWSKSQEFSVYQGVPSATGDDGLLVAAGWSPRLGWVYPSVLDPDPDPIPVITPYIISDSPDNITSIAAENLTIEYDDSGAASALYANGATDYTMTITVPADGINTGSNTVTPKYKVTLGALSKIYSIGSDGFISTTTTTAPKDSVFLCNPIYVTPKYGPREGFGYFYQIKDAGTYYNKLISQKNQYITVEQNVVPPVTTVTTGGTGWVNDAEPTWLSRYIDIPVATTQSERDAYGLVALVYATRSIIRGSCDVVREGILYRAGMGLLVTNRAAGLRKSLQLVQRVTTTFLSGTDVRRAAIEWGTAPLGSLGLRRQAQKRPQTTTGAIQHEVKVMNSNPMPGSTITLVTQMTNSAGQPWTIAGKVVNWSVVVYNAAGADVTTASAYSTSNTGGWQLGATTTQTDTTGKSTNKLKLATTKGYQYFVTATS